MEKIGEQVFHMPMSSRLQMSEERDRLALSYNRFFSVLEVPAPADNALTLRFAITPRGKIADAQLNLQLCLKAGQELETGAGRKLVLDGARIELGPEEIGGWIRHNGWTLKTDARARLAWPVYPFNPYADAPETSLERAIGTLSVPLAAGAQEIIFVFQAN